MNDTSPEPSTIGPFVVVRKLGEGAMGVVYEGFDERLDRKVALKLVRRQLLGNPAVRERMTREAQAMARLSNPNVVQVYQVGEHDGGIYVAMEYVEGETLTGWLRSASRPWQLVLRTICEAGRGLAAAHAAGLVHRDFKPDNVLIETGGQARVLDFGLVQADGVTPDGESMASEDTTTRTSEDEIAAIAGGERVNATIRPTPADALFRSNLHWSVRLTQIGNVLGTPAYMSPEQHFGRPAGAAADQFSFAVTLYEALYGFRPFNGDSWAAIRMQVQDGVVPPPPLESPVPRRLFKVLVRALSTHPEARWSSLGAMIAALEHDPWRVPLRVAGIAGLIAVASAVSYSMAVAQVEGGQRCQIAAEQLAGVWDAGREAEVARAFDATHLPFAADSAKRVRARVGAYARAWVSERQAACEEHAAGVRTSHQTDLRIACLDRRKARLAALVQVLTAADRAAVENAVQAVEALPSVSACSDASDLLAVVPPADAQIAARVDVLREQLVQADALESTGHYGEGLEIASRVRVQARALGYAPLEAEASLSEGRLLMSSAGGVRAEAALAHAVRLGMIYDLHLVAAEAAIIRIYILSTDLGRPAEAMATSPFAEALVQRASDADRLAALLHNNLGVAHAEMGTSFAVTHAEYEHALVALRRREQPDALEAIVHNNLGMLNFLHGRHEAARHHYARSEELFANVLGASHPLVAVPLIGRADVDERLGDDGAALPNYLHAVGLIESSQGPEHRYLIEPLRGLGHVYARAGQAAEATKHYARAVGIADKIGVKSEAVAEAIEGLADIAAADGSRPQALQLYERAADMFDAVLGKESEKGARSALRAGEVAVMLGDRDGAIQWFEHVLAKKPGASPGDASRAYASLQLAATLDRRGVGAGRVCALLDAGRAEVPESDPRRIETNELFARTCISR